MTKQYDYHYHFHQLLGHVTTIKSAVSVLVEDYQDQIKPEAYDILSEIPNHVEKLITEVDQLRSNVYQITDKK